MARWLVQALLARRRPLWALRRGAAAGQRLHSAVLHGSQPPGCTCGAAGAAVQGVDNTEGGALPPLSAMYLCSLPAAPGQG